jgi:hypothetical protein
MLQGDECRSMHHHHEGASCTTTQVLVKRALGSALQGGRLSERLSECLGIATTGSGSLQRGTGVEGATGDQVQPH